jgi:hypothetical protein
MFKKVLITTALVAIIGVLVFGAVNRTLAKNGSESISAGQGGYRHGSDQILASSEQPDGEFVQGQGNGGNGRYGQGAGGNGNGELADPPPAASDELSAEESAALLYMREEEKLAHDVYVTFYAKWGLPVFQNISQSEQTHTDAVKTLLDRYGLSDPASGAVGVFTNPDLQALYNDLVARGSQTLAEALKVGAEIEEIDILDLQERLSQTDNADIQQVFNNLLNGSHNHLRAFVSTLNTQTAKTYQPQYLGAEDYQTIISASMGRGGNGNGRGNGQGGNGGGGGGQGSRP